MFGTWIKVDQWYTQETSWEEGHYTGLGKKWWSQTGMVAVGRAMHERHRWAEEESSPWGFTAIWWGLNRMLLKQKRIVSNTVSCLSVSSVIVAVALLILKWWQQIYCWHYYRYPYISPFNCLPPALAPLPSGHHHIVDRVCGLHIYILWLNLINSKNNHHPEDKIIF